MKCEHVSCGASEKIWLPYTYKGRERGLKPHPYCTKCGLVNSVSSEKPRRTGYYINLVSDLNRFYKVTQIQMRMISKELESEITDDTYGLDRSMQDTVFIKIVKKYVSLPDKYLLELLH
jgi:hypothetical protein